MSETLISPATSSQISQTRQMFIGGEWVDASDGQRFESTNPYTGKVWATAPSACADDIDRAVSAARRALAGPWGEISATGRGHLIRRLADLIADNADRLATVETTDNGKVLREMAGQMAGLPDWYHYFAGAADKLEGRTIPVAKTNFLTYTRPEPVGVVGGITAWNSPLLLLTFKLAAALAAGCTFIAKPAEQTPVSTLEFARLVEEAGFPRYV